MRCYVFRTVALAVKIHHIITIETCLQKGVAMYITRDLEPVIEQVIY